MTTRTTGTDPQDIAEMAAAVEEAEAAEAARRTDDDRIKADPTEAAPAEPGIDTAAESGDADAIRADIKDTRAALGDTVAALAAKADVRAQVQDGVTHVKERVSEISATGAGWLRRFRAPIAGTFTAGAAIVAVLLVRKRRNRNKSPLDRLRRTK